MLGELSSGSANGTAPFSPHRHPAQYSCGRCDGEANGAKLSCFRGFHRARRGDTDLSSPANRHLRLPKRTISCFVPLKSLKSQKKLGRFAVRIIRECPIGVIIRQHDLPIGVNAARFVDYCDCTRQLHEGGRLSCSSPKIPAEALETAILSRIREIIASVQAREQIAQQAVTRRHPNQEVAAEGELAALTAAADQGRHRPPR